jgi:hypothetical protein
MDAEEIIKLIAAADPRDGVVQEGACVFCHEFTTVTSKPNDLNEAWEFNVPEMHAPTCPWRLAYEYATRGAIYDL